jgi:LmbE family N-acetylglucosaminyl deacetylase
MGSMVWSVTTPFLLPSSFSFAHQRVLILAPHPDDESLATGGLIQKALHEGAEVRVVFISDGENNPWPQRYLERRWSIGFQEKNRWGRRRRDEALAALRCLGVPESHAHFLGLPDQGTTSALLQARETPVLVLLAALDKWRPTLLVSPSPHDLHPDHNALAVMVNLALAKSSSWPDLRVIHYLVHTRSQRLPHPRWILQLSPEEQDCKRRAILQHGSQVALSGKRFIAYARNFENYYSPETAFPFHPVRSVIQEDGALRVLIQPAGGSLLRGDLLVASENALQESIRWRVPVRFRSGVARIQDAITGRPLRNATIRRTGRAVEVRLPLSSLSSAQRISLKFNRRTVFYDESGWQEFPFPASATQICPVLPFTEMPSSSSLFALSPSGGAWEVSA